jgi:type II secretory pathway component GspD/PulD (secretin)
MEKLKKDITKEIVPESWHDNGGQGRIDTRTETTLAVYQSLKVHKILNRYFKKLREELSKQIAIEARFLLVPDNFLEDSGLDVSGSTVDGVTSKGLGEIVVGPANSKEILAALEHKSLAERQLPELDASKDKLLDDLQNEFLLRATQAHAGVKQLHAPKVMVLNGESASMQINSQLKYIDISDEGKFIHKGTMLDILPTIQNDGKEVLLKGHILMTDVLENRPQEHNGKTYEIPYVQVANIPIHAVVKNTGTLLITGPELRSYKETVTNPGLRKIPVLGRHLSNQSIVDERYRILVLIKPTVIIPDEAEADAIGALAPISRDRNGGGAGGRGGDSK